MRNNVRYLLFVFCCLCIDTNPTSFEHAYILKDKGMYHNLELGMKEAFPMKFTDKDGDTLAINWEMIFSR